MNFLKTWLKCFAFIVGVLAGIVGLVALQNNVFPLTIPILTLLIITTAFAVVVHKAPT